MSFKNHNNINNALDYIPRHVAIIMDGNGRWAKKKVNYERQVIKLALGQ